MAEIINGTVFVPALNGTLIERDLCSKSLCSLDYAQVLYVPSMAGNAIYLCIFALCLAAQIFLGRRYRTWGFSIPMFCGIILEICGYIGRIGLSNNPFDFNMFVLYLVCLTIAPAFLSASIYLCLGRVVIVYGQHISRFSPRFYTLVFVTCDITSLVLQALGGGLAATSGPSSNSDTGVNIMIAGVSFQVVSLVVFIALSLDFLVAARKARPTHLDSRFATIRDRRQFRRFPYFIALATITIFIRCCFRVAELKDGFKGKVANNQALFMVFEGPMIIIAVFALSYCHPGVAFGSAEAWRSANWTWKKRSDAPYDLSMDSSFSKADTHTRGVNTPV